MQGVNCEWLARIVESEWVTVVFLRAVASSEILSLTILCWSQSVIYRECPMLHTRQIPWFTTIIIFFSTL